jgi:sec-independent protein translocase protein TatA
MSLTHWLVVAVLVLLLFGRGKISDLMGDVAKGIKSFKKGMADDETADAPPAAPARTIDHQPAPPPAAAPAPERTELRS